MKRIWLVRHAESQAQSGDARGMDTALSERGLEQAQRLRERLADTKFDHIRISPLFRTRQTYEAMSVQADFVTFDSRLLECPFGGTYESLLPYLPLPNYANEDPHNSWLSEATLRARSLVMDIPTWEGKNILLVGHWGIFSLFLMWFLGHPSPIEPAMGYTESSAPVDNASISILGYQQKRFGNCIVAWNDNRHIEDLLAYSVRKLP